MFRPFPKTDIAKAIIRRFTNAMINYDHNFQGYQLTTLSDHAKQHWLHQSSELRRNVEKH
jgi:hypothetical protein